ncbi:MAG: tetratricopeptide repeat protein [Opitutus sp.]
MRKQRILLFVFILAVVAAAIGAWWWSQSGGKQQLVLASLPAAPDLSGTNPTMRERILGADLKARSRAGALSGLAELAQIYHANGFLDEAVRCYDGLEKLEPKQARWLHLHASILAGYGEADAALAIWQKALALAPEYVPARLRLADVLLKANRPREAAEAYNEVLKLDPKEAHALFGLARIDFEAQRWDQARERLEAVVNQTNYQLGYDLIVTLYERLGLQDRARSIRGMAAASGAYRDPVDPWLDSLVQYCFDPFRLSLNAGVAARLGDRAGAQALLERAVELTPNDVAPRFQLGTLAVEQGNFALAADQLERCTILSPEFSDAWAHLSDLQMQRGDPATAERTLAAGLRNCPQSPGLHLMKARNLAKAGRADEAVNEFMIAARLRPNEPDAFLELGNTLITMNRVAEGVEQLKAALNAQPDNPMALSILSYHAITTGDEVEARRWLTRIDQQPRVPRDNAVRLAEAYRNQFGREWIWTQPR